MTTTTTTTLNDSFNTSLKDKENDDSTSAITQSSLGIEQHHFYAGLSRGVSYDAAVDFTRIKEKLLSLSDEKIAFHLKNGDKEVFPKEADFLKLKEAFEDLELNMGEFAEKFEQITLDEVVDFGKKNQILENYFEPLTPKEFYRYVFPEGSFERSGHPEDFKGNGIVMARCILKDEETGKRFARVARFFVFDELNEIEKFENAEFAVMTPISYVGNSRKNANARYVHALVFDIDAVSPDKLNTMLYYFSEGIAPKPTMIVNSGHGVHLYYCLKNPVAAWKNNLKELTKLKHALTDVLWNKETSDDPKVHHQSATQSFRMPGSLTKFNTGITLDAFLVGEPVTLHELMSFLKAQPAVVDFYHLEPYLQREEQAGIKVMVDGVLKTKFDYDSKVMKVKRIRSSFDLTDKETRNTNLKEAAAKWPEWHERRIIQGKPRGRWTNNRAVYDWWLNRIKNEIQVGARYHSISILASLAIKCDIDYEELLRDATDVFNRYRQLDGASSNPFTFKEMTDALGMYQQSFVYYSISAMEANSKLSIPKNKRNGRPQAIHVKNITDMRDRDYPDGGWRNVEGRPKKEDEVTEYILNNPGLTPTQYSKALGVSRPTIYKYLKNL